MSSAVVAKDPVNNTPAHQQPQQLQQQQQQQQTPPPPPQQQQQLSQPQLQSQTQSQPPVQPQIPQSEQLQQSVEESIRLIEDLKFFLATAPANWQENQIIRRYYLNHDEGFVSCVFWNNLYFVTGTDIVKCLIYRFEQFGRTITDRKKFEEGVFSDLRNLKCGTDAILEPPKSKFLEFLYKNSCLRTQKKQKVFFWFSVQHDKLFADALERDLKREMVDQKTTTRADREPALSFKYDDSKSLYEQLTSHIEDKKKALGLFTNNASSNLATAGAIGGAAFPNSAAGGVSSNPAIPTAYPIDPENPYAYLQLHNQLQRQQHQPSPHFLPQTSYQQQQANAAAFAAGAFGGQIAPASLQQHPAAPPFTGPDEPEYGTTDDDFPLDFFPQNDYISETIDPSQAFVNNNVPLFDPNIFLNPNLIGGAAGAVGANGLGAGSLVNPSFDDFLIDQASPFSPGPPHPDLVEKEITDAIDNIEGNEQNNNNDSKDENKNDPTEANAAMEDSNSNQTEDKTAKEQTEREKYYENQAAAAFAPMVDFANPLLNPAAAAAATASLYPQMNPQLAFAAQAQAGLIPGANPSFFGLGAPGDYLMNPYLAAAAADPGVYYEQMAALQAQQQMMGMMNPGLLAPGMGQIAPGAAMPAPNAFNQLQRQKLIQQQQQQLASGNRLNKQKNVKPQPSNLAQNGRINKPSNLNHSFTNRGGDGAKAPDGNENYLGNSNGLNSNSEAPNGIKKDLDEPDLSDVLHPDPKDDDLISTMKRDLA